MRVVALDWKFAIMNVNFCFPFLVFLAVVAFLGYKRFVKSSDTSATISRAAKTRIFVFVLLALLLAFSLVCLLIDKGASEGHIPEHFPRVLVTLASAVLLAMVANLLVPDGKGRYVIVAFAASLAPILFFLLFKEQLSISALLWALLVVTAGSAAVTLIILLRM
jgi:hypothetical protein